MFFPTFLYALCSEIHITLQHERGFHRLVVHDNLQENCVIELLRLMRSIMGAFPRLSVLPFFWYSSTLNNNLHGNQCNNFHISDILDFLWNSNVRKRPFTNMS